MDSNKPIGYWAKRLDGLLEYHLDDALRPFGLHRPAGRYSTSSPQARSNPAMSPPSLLHSSNHVRPRLAIAASGHVTQRSPSFADLSFDRTKDYQVFRPIETSPKLDRDGE